MDKLKLGIIFGGPGEEHPVSVKSARRVADNLDLARYEPHWIGVTENGSWRLCEGPGDGWDREGRPVVLAPDRGVHGLLDGDRAIRLDVVLPVMHGRFGEDGALQGLLELSGIPYVGCDVQASAVCMDKSLTYIVARAAGITTPDFRILAADEKPEPGELTYPVFVKPARSGSSFGVTKVTGPDDLAAAIETAREYDTKVLIEQGITGSEVGCAVLGDGPHLFASEPDRIALSHGIFRIHQETDPESGSENSTPIVPADITPEARALVQETAKAVYRALGCRGLSRVDLFLTAGGDVVLNEVNTLPGLTPYSRYPRMMEASGVPLSGVIDRLVSLAMTGGTR
ncbi:putative D-alanine--D-lactate ligase [Actinorhabdospora filicis]|uniref:D-alanine--D-alanine ligase n=1 Tax=Actinorhabdospora filicis TaxID=1785913 RepID=A0A9W6W9I2_9ACTN|nr:D-alanine--D-alanine ligase family protein [Actinorhabdospora filicis]GLZ78023.1 putative D-alanine--D-lactate ligase [Actinorhabdospora filicis]